MTKLTELVGSDDNDAATVAKLTEFMSGDLPAQVFDTPDGRTFAVRRMDFLLDNITPAHAQQIEHPKWVTAAVKTQKASSLSAYVNRFKNPGTMLFADMQTNVIVGAIDYHRQPSDPGHEDIENPSPRLGTHNVTLALQYSEEWKRWSGQNGKLVDQVEFADFLEENGYDVTAPSGADLLELCRDLHATHDSSFKSIVRNGDVVKVELQKENNATTGEGLELPNEFQIFIPVYFGEPKVQFTCLMRRKIVGSSLTLGFKIIRMEAKRQDEFQRIVEAVSVDTNTPAIYGAK